jgi:hypothetical protein
MFLLKQQHVIYFPLKILVSCKKYKRKLDQQDIDAFNGELISSGAHKGVIYSYSGFNKYAIEKCKVLGISCCKLYLASWLGNQQYEA